MGDTNAIISEPKELSEQTRRSIIWTTLGIALLVFAIYALSGPGRIDIIDGQLRYEVASNLLKDGRPVLRDPAILSNPMIAVKGRDRSYYSYYCVAGSVLAVPFVWLGGLLGNPNGDGQRFLFSFASGAFGALATSLLYLFYLRLGVSRKRALLWALVSAFATLLWPASTSTFDNAQHSFFSLLAVYLGYRSAVKNSIKLAVMGGLCAGILINYQEYFVLLVPTLALSTLEWSDFNKVGASASAKKMFSWMLSLAFGVGNYAIARRRYLAFIVASWSGVVVFFAYNYLRFGSIFDSGKFEIIAQGHPQFLGSFFIGLPGLLISPGKSIFLYSPPIILGLIGIKRLWRTAPQVALSLTVSSFVLLMFLSKISFFGGDWCWGPRYLVILLPIWAVAFPFLPGGKIYRVVAVSLIVAGFVVQLMALSLDAERFFLEHNLPGHFWADQPGFYMSQSALFDRAGEIMSLRNGVPPTALQFTQTPYDDTVTYCLFGVRPINGLQLPQWMQQYQVFYLPRPWPFWMTQIDSDSRPVNFEAWLAGLLLMAGLGVYFIHRGLRTSDVRQRLAALKETFETGGT